MSYRAVLRSRRVRVLWSSQAFSVMGDRIFTLAVMWMVWAETGSAVLMGAVAIAESVPFVVIGLFGRRLTSWARTLRQLAVIDVLRAVLVFVLPLVFSATLMGVASLLSLVFVIGALTALFDPSFVSRLPRESDAESVAFIYGLFDLSARVARVAGPALAGVLLVVLSNQYLLWINAATFLVSAAALYALRPRTPSARAGDLSPQQEHPRREAEARRVSPRLLPQLKLVLAVHGANIFAYGAIIALPALIATRLDRNDPAVYGVAIAAYGLGAVAMNPVAVRTVRRFAFVTVYCIAAIVFAVALGSLCLAPNAAVLVALMFLGGATSPFCGIALLTFVAGAYPEEERRHVLTTDQTIIRTAGTLGVAFFPALATFDPTIAFASAGALAGTVALTALIAGKAIAGRAASATRPAISGEEKP